MEAFPSLQSTPQSTLMQMQMQMQMQIQQQLHTPPPQSVSLSPGKCILPHRHAMKGGCENEEGENDGELLFDIEEFLVDEDALIHGNNSNSNSGDENEGATIIAESPTNTNTNSNPFITVGNGSYGIANHPIPATNNTATTTTSINIHKNNNNNTTTHKKRRKRRSRSKKNADSIAPPKRPLSGYNLYFREERKRCVSETTSFNSPGTSKKYNFEELGKLIGKRWRSLPLKEKCELEVRADSDRERYRTEMIAYRREKHRKGMEEDEDTLTMMRQRSACRHSPTLKAKQPIPEVLSSLHRHITISPGQRDCHAQKVQQPYLEDKQLLRPEDAWKIPHVRKVSLSKLSPPYPRENTDFRSRNNASPAVSSYRSCSSWSGDGSEDDEDDRVYKHTKKNDEDGRKGRCTVRSDNSIRTLPNKAVEHPSTPSNNIQQSHLHLPCFENDLHKSQIVSPHGGVAVARVVAMPATDGLRRILQDGHPSHSLLPGPGVHKQQQLPQPQPPYSWIPRMNGRPQQYLYQHHRQQHPHQQHPYSYPSPPSRVAGDRRLYTPPSPPQGSFGSPHLSSHPSPHQAHHPQQQQQQQPPPPQMLPMGMEIFLRDPATGRERSYRVQYTHKCMTAEEANQFQRLHE